ncbi:HET-domain-containing protein [Aspergillus eucalypticola CBS 122712]|uniref:HET-domain-containing protein n=1 Tax=Aspergillus eucalypticola (strain CBS 122712 / IBT 29274) TaxID=1448314 RepID=A0A317W2H2_ASPEC|nr:HET-domain-containing protein [Aspergillus eucalypticola CBS 122712]PWY80195.1 HET-domain-containing protein [Aspergillus eucalypticola CBS 122712]
MSPGLKCNSDLTEPSFTYTELPRESPHPTTRMMRLLPNKDKDAELECELFNYDLTSGSGADSHLYEALSYVWGSKTRSRTIKLNSRAFPVTENLYLALSRLRNRQLERILWVDAICINQDDLNEKTEQIPLMRTIYAQAQHVTVWLGEAYGDGDKALEGLRCLAEGQDVDIEGCGALCVNLFERAWFRRIWVLQEVGVARSIYIMCGSVQINGHALCEGLKRMRLPAEYQEKIGPVAFLIKGALVRPKYEPGSRGFLTIGELVGMYCYHDATEQHDKIYALLGLSADPMTSALTPNYALPWNTVFNQVTSHMFPDCSVDTWPESDIAIIRGVGWVLGHICSVRHVSNFGQQEVKVYLNDTARSIGYENDWEADWDLQTFAQAVNPGDIVFLLQGASRPSIIRLCKDHFRIITPAVTLCKRRPRESLEGTSRGWHTPDGSCDILLAWRIPLNNDTRSQKWPETELPDMVPAYQEQSLEAKYRRNNITRIMAGAVMEALALEKSEDDDVARLLVLRGTDDSVASRLTKSSAKDIRCFPDKIMQSLFPSERNDLSISEEMVKAVAENEGPCGYIIMELLFQLQGSSLPITKEVVEAAAGNRGVYGDQVMKAIYRHRGEFFPVSEEVVKAAAGNTGRKAPKILKFLFKTHGEALPVSEKVLKVAVGNDTNCGFEILKVIVHYRGQNLPVSEDVIITAMENYQWGYGEIHYLFECCDRKVPVSGALVKAAVNRPVPFMRLLIEQAEGSLPKGIPISEEVIKVAAGNIVHGVNILKLLFQHAKGRLPISENVVKAAAGNLVCGDRVLEVLFQQKGERLPISEEVVRTAAGNLSLGHEIINLLFQQKGERLPISEEVVRTAAGNDSCGHEIINLLFQQKGERLPISEEVVRTAAGNLSLGHKIINLLFQQKGERLPISEEVIITAAGNDSCGHEIINLLFQQKGGRLPISEEVVKAAAGNSGSGFRVLEVLFQQKKERIPISEEVINAAVENISCVANILRILPESPESPESSESAESSDSSESPESSESSLSSDELDEED